MTNEEALQTGSLGQCYGCHGYFDEQSLQEVQVDARGYWKYYCPTCLEKERIR